MYKLKFVLIGSMLTLLVNVILISPPTIQAAELNDRSLAISNSAVSGISIYNFTFTLPDTTNIGSIGFLFCTEPLAVENCITPSNIDVSHATLISQSGETGFAITEQDTNMILISRTPAGTNAEQVQYIFSNITNPSYPPQTYFVRISTYTSDDGTGSNTDFGAVATSTATGVYINTQVPPILDFCVGLVITGNCSTAIGYFIQFGDFSTLRTASATSMMEAGTNAKSGIIITVNGTTMTSGNYVINNLTLQTPSIIGTSQFGLNLRANTNPIVGSDPIAGSTIPNAAYDVPNQYQFNSGDVVAYAPGPTNLTKLTVSYIVNISTSQTVGIYDSTLTYICTASF
jgi:hypothetical protein